jgi:lysophospholipase L1-like esterase
MKILCLGDSLTYGFGVDPQDTWVSLTAERTKLELVNRGVNGDTTGGMLARFRKDAAAYSPDNVLLMGGSNDIFVSGSADSAKTNMSDLVHQARTLSIAPLIGTPPPLDVRTLWRDWADQIDVDRSQKLGDEYVQWLRLFAGASDIPLVDFRRAFESASDPERLYLDGLHPTPAGHRLMADVLCRRLSEEKYW